MIVSDLFKPVPACPDRPQRVLPLRTLTASASLLVGMSALCAILWAEASPTDPTATGAISVAAPPVAAAPSVAVAPAEPPMVTAERPPAPAQTPQQQVAVENGVVVIRGAPGGSASPAMLKVPDLVPARPAAKSPDPQLIESTAAGPLPKIARDGRRPSAVYAAAPVLAVGKPRIALVVGGMGLDRAATARASAELPAAVTFGFAPYGEDLAQQVGLARGAGHEVVLQMPMEDFRRDEGALSHMLKTGEGNSERLRWLMSRFVGYAGVANYLGGRLLADEDSLKPVLQGIASRGLYFIDDGTAPRSLAVPLAHDLSLAAVRADVVLDAQSDPAYVAAALLRLEKLARERGSALGTATGRAATSSVIARYLAEAAMRGLAVVPVSQLVSDSAALSAGH